eukprot:gene32075-38790_t
MECEDDYATDAAEILQAAKEIESDWLRADSTRGVDSTRASLIKAFPSTEVPNCGYRAMAIGLFYFNNAANGCERCGNQETTCWRKVIAGCRRNGDGYGSEFYYCRTCGLFDWDSYDEA